MFYLAMQGVQVQSLVRELRSHMPRGQKNRTLKKRKKKEVIDSIKKYVQLKEKKRLKKGP